MTIDQALCSELDRGHAAHDTYVHDAIRVAGGQRSAPLPGSQAIAVVRFEVIHDDPICKRVLADACVLVVAQTPAIVFVAPDDAAANNYVSYWHRESPAAPGKPGWAPLSGGQRSDTEEVLILGQTLPVQIAEQGGAGGLSYVQDTRPGDGWTVSVGVAHLDPDDTSELGDLMFEVFISARPDWSPQTGALPIQIAGTPT